MIRRVMSCPYCGAGEIAFDYQTANLVLNPDSARQRPCEHLLCVNGSYCRGEMAPDGGQSVAFAKVNWQHPQVARVPPDQLCSRARALAVPDTAPGDDPSAAASFRVERFRFDGAKRLTGESLVRWFDQLGWDKASEDRVPHEEFRLTGWIVFARHPADALGLLAAD